MGESTCGPLPRHSHGGLSADFAWLRDQNQGRIAGSPVRYGMPEAHILSNGRNRNELHQIYAAGHDLALTHLELPDAPYIKKLVEARQRYGDALIHGRQIGQPPTGSDAVIAYHYVGSTHSVLAAVNITPEIRSAELVVPSGAPASWINVLTGEGIAASAGRLRFDVEGEGLVLLVNAQQG